jgi:AcrR family transcriptional regulator
VSDSRLDSIAAEAEDILAPPARQRALEAMASLCAERGYRQATLEQVAERSGLTVAEMRSMFESTEECGAAAVDTFVAAGMAIVSAHHSPDLPESDSMLLAALGILELLAAWPAFAKLSFVCARQMGPPRLGTGLETGMRMLSSMLERLGENAGGPPLPPLAARGAIGGAEAVVRREIVEGRTPELPRLLPDIAYAAAVAPLGQEEALRLADRAQELLEETAWGPRR